jgi:hypothetical protein
VKYYRWDAIDPEEGGPPIFYRIADDGSTVEVYRDGSWVTPNDHGLYLELTQDVGVTQITEDDVAA